MNTGEIIVKVEEFVKSSLRNHDGGHDWWHIERVRRMALKLHEAEGVGDRMVIEVSALLHDVDDKKFTERDDRVTGNKIRSFLADLDISQHATEKIVEINRKISFSSGEYPGVPSDEFMIVQDADRLDAIGAIGIARAFNYGGYQNNILYDPEGRHPCTIGHFYDKLLKLKEMMNTETARKIADERHEFLECFLDQFYKEWDDTAISPEKRPSFA